MGVFWEAVLTFFAVFGLIMLIWVLLGRMLRPIPGRGMCILLPGQGGGEGLEGTLRGVIWLRSLGLIRCPVIIADAGLDQEGKALVGRLTQQWSQVYRCPVEELGENLSCLKRE